MFWNVIVLELASQLIQAVLAVVSAVTPHAAVYTPLSLTLLSVVSIQPNQAQCSINMSNGPMFLTS